MEDNNVKEITEQVTDTVTEKAPDMVQTLQTALDGMHVNVKIKDAQLAKTGAIGGAVALGGYALIKKAIIPGFNWIKNKVTSKKSEKTDEE